MGRGFRFATAFKREAVRRVLDVSESGFFAWKGRSASQRPSYLQDLHIEFDPSQCAGREKKIRNWN